MNKDTSNSSAPITLEDIAQKKAELQKQILQQKEIISQLGKDLIAPAKPIVHQGNKMMRVFNTGMAAFDGIITGIKIMRKFKKFLR